MIKNDFISEELELFLASTPDLALIKGIEILPNGEMRSVYRGASPAFVELVGRNSAEELDGLTDSELFGQGELAERYSGDDKRVIESGKALPSYIEPLPEKDGKPRWASTVKFPLRDSAGSVIGVWGIGRDITEAVEAGKGGFTDAARLILAVETDAMTGFLNHNATIKHIKAFIERESGVHSLFMIDADNFKAVNDSMGHQQGDAVIVSISDAIRSVFRQEDIIGRVGGDEFLVLMKNAGDEHATRRKARELNSALQFKVSGAGKEIDLSASIGISMTSGDGKNFDRLYREADTALYRAKDRGKNCFYLLPDENSEVLIEESGEETDGIMQLHLLFDSMDAGVVVVEVGEDVRPIYVSRSFYTNMKRTKHETGGEGEKLLSLIVPEDLPAVISAARSAASGEVTEAVYRVRSTEDVAAAGEEFEWRHMRASSIPAKKGEKRVIAVITDVTKMKTAEEQLRLAEERYRIAMKQTGGLIWEVDIASKTLYQPEEVSRFFGAEGTVFANAPESVIELGVIGRESRSEFRRMYSDIYSNNESDNYLLLIRSATGGFMHVKSRYEFLRDLRGKPMRAIGVSSVMSNVEPELRAFEDEKRLMKALSETLLGSIAVNLTRDRVDEFSTRGGGFRFSSYTEMYSALSRMIVNDGDFEKMRIMLKAENLLASFRVGQSWQYASFSRISRSGETHRTNLSLSLLRHPLTGDVYAFGFYSDVDRIYRLEEQVGAKGIKRDAVAHMYTQETLRRLYEKIAAGMSETDCCVFTVVEICGLEGVKRDLGLPAASRLISEFGRVCRVLINGSAIAGMLDETHALIIRMDFGGEVKHKALCERNNRQTLAVFKKTNPELELELVCGFTVASASSSFDELLGEAKIACSLSHKLPGHPVCRYAQAAPAQLNAAMENAPSRQRVLIADDEKISRKQLRRALEITYDVLEAENGEKALSIVLSGGVSLVITDLMMPCMDGFALIRQMKQDEALSRIPVIVITADERAETEIKALEAGASDVIVKPFVASTFLSRVSGILARRQEGSLYEQNRLYQLRLEQQERLIQIAEYDSLTGLYNRQAFYRHTREKLDLEKNSRHVIMRWDLDNFKILNDFNGVSVGDKALRDIAQRARRVFPDGSVIARLDSDHFVACAAIDEAGVMTVYNDMLAWAESYPVEFRFSFRVGIYVIDDAGIDVGLMCDRALLALRSVKGSYTSHIKYYDESLRQRLLSEQQLVSEMNSALLSNQFVLCFQPQYDTTEEIPVLIGAEALVRWKHPTEGLLPPGRFIPLFEKNGFITTLDRYVWDKACAYLRSWLDEGLNPLPVSVNISRLNLYNPRLVAVFHSLVEKYDIEPSLLHLEITESAFMGDQTLLIEVVKQLQQSGFVVEMDDFGSGYSSLNTLKDVPVDVLKLDLRFLVQSENASRGGIIINSVLRMAHWLNMPVIAEGVETAMQADYLKTVGCTLAQGYLFARPMPDSDYKALMTSSAAGGAQGAVHAFSAFDAVDFWNPEAQTTLVFNSFVDAAGIFEYRGGHLRGLRLNDKYYAELGVSRRRLRAMREDLLPLIHPQGRGIFIANIESAVKTGAEISSVTRWQLGDRTVPDSYIKIRMRRIAKSSDMYILYLAVENVTEQRLTQTREKAALERERAAVSVQLAENERNKLIIDAIGALIFDYDCASDTLFFYSGRGLEGYIRREIKNYLANIGDGSTVRGDCLDGYRAEFKKALSAPAIGTYDYYATTFGTGSCLNRARWASVAGDDGKVCRIAGVVVKVDEAKGREV
ncbi:MAG: EAL domain-containing protein [Eubacteriales bacterium]|nr:EAL domain-containing protein [Eubacteriales bacterium]